MSLSPTTSAGPTPTGSGPWLLRGRSPFWLIGLSALCGVGLAAAGMMLMRAADGAGVKDVVADLRRPAAPVRTAASAPQPAPANGLAPSAPPESVARAPVPVETAKQAPSAKPAPPTNDIASPSGAPEPSHTAAIGPAATPPSPAKTPDEHPVVTSRLPTPPPTVASGPAIPVQPTAGPANPAPAQTATVTPPAAPAREGSVIKRDALSPVKPQRTAIRPASSLPAADAQAKAAREPEARRNAVASAPAGLRAVAAPAGSAANVRAYTMDGGQNSSGNGVRIVRVEVPGSR